MASYSLLSKLVSGVEYVGGGGDFDTTYIAVSPISGNCLVEVTAAQASQVDTVRLGGSDPRVLWEPWSAGNTASAARDVTDIPWTAIRITATNCYVNISGQN